MPIKGLTDRGLAFPEIGQIRKGAKKPTDGKRPGADLTYFRVEFDEQEKTAAADFLKVYKDKPAQIRIFLPFNEIERMWDAWLEAYTAGRLVARSDGEWITYQLDNSGEVIVHNGLDANGNRVPHPVNGIGGYDYKGEAVKFKPTGRLKVIVPELARAAYLTVMTTSTHDIGNISSQLAAFKELNGGQLAGIPFVLRRRPKAISTPSGENGQRARRVKWLISIEADPKWVRAKIGQISTLALPASIEDALLPDTTQEDESAVTEWDDDEVIDEAPEAVNQETGEAAEAIELIDPMGSWAVEYAAKAWNVERKDAAKSIASKNLGKQIDKRDFIQIVTGQ